MNATTSANQKSPRKKSTPRHSKPKRKSLPRMVGQPNQDLKAHEVEEEEKEAFDIRERSIWL